MEDNGILYSLRSRVRLPIYAPAYVFFGVSETVAIRFLLSGFIVLGS